jgi:hypothetical protein
MVKYFHLQFAKSFNFRSTKKDKSQLAQGRLLSHYLDLRRNPHNKVNSKQTMSPCGVMPWLCNRSLGGKITKRTKASTFVVIIFVAVKFLLIANVGGFFVNYTLQKGGKNAKKPFFKGLF